MTGMKNATANALVGMAIALELFVALLVVWYVHDGLRDMLLLAS